MKQFNIKEISKFIRILLTMDKFDNWMLVSGKVQKMNTFEIDGQAIDEYFGEKDHNMFIEWGHIRSIICAIIKGKDLPLFMKFILRENESNTGNANIGLLLDIIYKNQKLILRTAVSYNLFTLDKSKEKMWDDKIQNMLNKMDVDYIVEE